MTSDDPNNGCEGDYSLNDCEVSGATKPSAKGAPSHPDPEIRERKGFSKKNFFFRSFGLHFAPKKGVGGGGAPPGLLPWALLLDLPLELACVAGGILAGECGT